MRVLGIESSCDESAVAVVEDGRLLLSQAIASQADLHARFGGIVPEVASRQHLLEFLPVLQKAVEGTGGWGAIDAVAVTRGPGLAGSLLVGLNLAKALAFARRLPFVGIHHLEGHLYANWVQGGQWDGEAREPPPFPSVALIVSGGHTDLVYVEGHGRYRLLGRTRDDAAGEAFDKAARLLGLGFPGGPPVERASREARQPVAFPRPTLRDGSDDFSFSGLKTAVLRAVEERKGTSALTAEQVADLAAGFQRAVVDTLTEKLVKVVRDTGAQAVLLSGGVAANGALRQEVIRRSPVPVWCPRPALCTDNGVMIAACAYFRLQAGLRHGWDLDVQPNLPLVP